MSAPTVRECAEPIAQLLGCQSLDPNDGEPSITDSDLRAIARVMTQALFRINRDGPIETRERPGSGVLNAPTALTVNATNGSAVITVTGWASWMAGCTIRIPGDSLDNEIISATLLARPFIGTTGALAATVYGDCITLDETTSKVLSPMLVGSGSPVVEVTTRQDFIRMGGFMGGTASSSLGVFSLPFYSLGPKPSAQTPSIFYVDAYHDASLDYVQRRIRFSPMPSAQIAISYTASVNPKRITATDIQGVGTTDPGTKLPIVDGAVESIFMPIAMQLATSLPTFKNESLKPEIYRQYQQALKDLQDSRASVKPGRGRYL